MSPKETSMLAKIQKDLSEIKTYLYNDEKTGTPGAIQKLTELEQRVQVLEETNKIEAAKKALLVFIGGIIMGLIQWAFKYFTAKG